MSASIVFGALVYIVLNLVTAMALPEGMTWVEYVEQAPNMNGLISLPTFHAAYLLLGNIGVVFLGVSVLAAILSGILGFYMATSRLLYSMAKERVLPAWFGSLSKDFKTPSNAILFIMVISLIAPFFGRNVLGWIVDMSSLGAAIGYGYTSAAAAKMAKKEGNHIILATGVIGTIMGILFCVLLLVPIPVFNCSLGKESYICLLVWIILGAFFYKKAIK